MAERGRVRSRRQESAKLKTQEVYVCSNATTTKRERQAVRQTHIQNTNIDALLEISKAAGVVNPSHFFSLSSVHSQKKCNKTKNNNSNKGKARKHHIGTSTTWRSDVMLFSLPWYGKGEEYLKLSHTHARIPQNENTQLHRDRQHLSSSSSSSFCDFCFAVIGLLAHIFPLCNDSNQTTACTHVRLAVWLSR